MRTLQASVIVGALFILAPVAAFAQDFGALQLRLWAQIYRAQYPFVGLYTGRVDGRPNRKAGFPPSAADNYSGSSAYSFNPNDCAEIESFAPDARPGWQSRVWHACR